jgi:hypothetical protein
MKSNITTESCHSAGENSIGLITNSRKQISEFLSETAIPIFLTSMIFYIGYNKKHTNEYNFYSHSITTKDLLSNKLTVDDLLDEFKDPYYKNLSQRMSDILLKSISYLHPKDFQIFFHDKCFEKYDYKMEIAADNTSSILTLKGQSYKSSNTYQLLKWTNNEANIIKIIFLFLRNCDSELFINLGSFWISVIGESSLKFNIRSIDESVDLDDAQNKLKAKERLQFIQCIYMEFGGCYIITEGIKCIIYV